jgi:hypothetical protein
MRTLVPRPLKRLKQLTNVQQEPLFTRCISKNYVTREIKKKTNFFIRIPNFRLSKGLDELLKISGRWFLQKVGCDRLFIFQAAPFDFRGHRVATQRRLFALFRQHRNTAGGPPNLKKGVGEMSMYCSMFVIACYQAVLGDDAVTGQVMGLDAKFTSPMTLDGYLRSKGELWEEVNVLSPPA